MLFEYKFCNIFKNVDRIRMSNKCLSVIILFVWNIFENIFSCIHFVGKKKYIFKRSLDNSCLFDVLIWKSLQIVCQQSFVCQQIPFNIQRLNGRISHKSYVVDAEFIWERRSKDVSKLIFRELLIIIQRNIWNQGFHCTASVGSNRRLYGIVA